VTPRGLSSSISDRSATSPADVRPCLAMLIVASRAHDVTCDIKLTPAR
jgi:hypothetical protein